MDKNSDTINTEKKPKRMQGLVVSMNSLKTIKVKVETKKPHPLYGKIVKSHKSYLVHNDPENNIGVEGIVEGDEVMIEESKPISKNKNFILISKIERK